VWKEKMKIVTIIVLVVVALFFLLPILSGNASIPEDISATEIGHFIGGFAGYWIDALKSVFTSL
jgi:L-asparagine transporter-like permease